MQASRARNIDSLPLTLSTSQRRVRTSTKSPAAGNDGMPCILYLPLRVASFGVSEHLQSDYSISRGRQNITVVASVTLRRHAAAACPTRHWTSILDLAVIAPVDPSNFVDALAAALAPYARRLSGGALSRCRRFFADRIVATTVEHDLPRGFASDQ
jgi:hypothetical protein